MDMRQVGCKSDSSTTCSRTKFPKAKFKRQLLTCQTFFHKMEDESRLEKHEGKEREGTISLLRFGPCLCKSYAENYGVPSLVNNCWPSKRANGDGCIIWPLLLRVPALHTNLKATLDVDPFEHKTYSSVRDSSVPAGQLPSRQFCLPASSTPPKCASEQLPWWKKGHMVGHNMT